MKYTCSMETVQQNGRFTLFSSKFPSDIYSILYAYTALQIMHHPHWDEANALSTIPVLEASDITTFNLQSASSQIQFESVVDKILKEVGIILQYYV